MKRAYRILFPAFAGLLILALGACSSAPKTGKVAVDGGTYTNVDASGLDAMLKNKNFPLINVHIPYEGELVGTDAFIPYDQITANLDKLPADKNARVVLYCRSGRMSDIAARELVKLGYTDIWNLDGGMVGWEALGKPLQHKGQ